MEVVLFGTFINMSTFSMIIFYCMCILLVHKLNQIRTPKLMKLLQFTHTYLGSFSFTYLTFDKGFIHIQDT